MSHNALERLSRLIRERILTNGSAPRLGLDTPLLSFGLDLDSVAVLQLIMETEKEFGVVFEDSDVSIELFKTLGTLAAAIERKLGAEAGSPAGTTGPGDGRRVAE